MHRRSRCLIIALAAALVSGCGLDIDVPLRPSPTIDEPAQGPDCFGINESVDRDPHTVENLLTVADWIVIADVVATRDGRWDTSDGEPPEAEVRPRAGIVTPVDVVVQEVLVGAGPEGDVRVVIEGGTVGCVVHTIDPPAPALLPGDRYALVMVPNLDATGVEHPQEPLVLEAWPIDADGDIVTTLDGTITVDELAAMAGA